MTIWCKICGITTAADARVVEQAGADAIGLNCYPPSPRYIEPEVVGELSAAVGCTRVALFVDPEPDHVRAVLDVAAIDILQFQGDESPRFCGQFGLPYMKGIRMSAETSVAQLVKRYDNAWAFLLDTFVEGIPGGTGRRFDLDLWPDLPDLRLVLAGGLDPQNVAAAITQVSPFGVDVAGGVEGTTKRRKDPVRVEQFVQEVRSVGSD